MAAHRAILLAEMTGQEQIDVHLRGAVDGVARKVRERGYTLVPPDEVNQTLSGINGSELERLGALRTKLNADFIVRVNARPKGPGTYSVQVWMLTSGGARAQELVTPPEGAEANVAYLADSMLPPAIPGAVPPVNSAAPSAPDRVVLKDNTVLEGRILQQDPGKFVVIQLADGSRRTVPWDQVASVTSQPNAPAPAASSGAGGFRFAAPDDKGAQWEARSGSLITWDIQVLLLGALYNTKHTVTKVYGNQETMVFTGNGHSGGAGGGTALHIGYMYMFPPNFATASTTWGAIRLGTGFEWAYQAYGYQTPARAVDGVLTSSGTAVLPGSAQGGDTTWTSAYTVAWPIQLGGMVGVGSFSEASRWNGVALGLNWRPTYFYTKPSTSDASAPGASKGFSVAGFELTGDFGSLQATGTNKPEANLRLSLIFHARHGELPLYGGLGIGAVWY